MPYNIFWSSSIAWTLKVHEIRWLFAMEVEWFALPRTMLNKDTASESSMRRCIIPVFCDKMVDQG